MILQLLGRITQRSLAAWLGLSLLFGLVGPAVSLAQTPPTDTSRLRVKLEGEPVPVSSQAYPQLPFTMTAYDSEGVVQNLGKERLKATIDDTPIEVNDVVAELNQDTELAVAVLLDTSGSMYGNNPSNTNSIPAAKTALKTFVGKLNNRDKLAILTFNENAEPQTGTPGTTDFLADKSTLYNVIDAIPDKIDAKNYKPTRIYSSLFNTIGDVARQNTAEKRVVVILSDGEDTASGTNDIKLGDVLDRARERNVVVYAIGLGEDVSKNPAFEQTLKTLSSLNGGRYSYAATANDLAPLYGNIAQQLKTRYRVALDAKAFPPDNKEHVLKVRVTTANGDSAELKTSITAFYPVTPQVELSGLTDGAEVNSKITITPQIKSRFPVTQVEYRVLDSTDKEVVPARVIDKAPYALVDLPTSGLAENSKYKLTVTVKTARPNGTGTATSTSSAITATVAPGATGSPVATFTQSGSNAVTTSTDQELNQTITLGFSIGARPTVAESNMWWLWALLAGTLLAVGLIVLLVIASNRRRSRIALETQAMSTFTEPDWSGPPMVGVALNSVGNPTIESEARNLNGSGVGSNLTGNPVETLYGEKNRAGGNSNSSKSSVARTILDADADAVEAVAMLVLRGSQQRVFKLKPGRTTLGRDDANNDVVLTDPTVSARHAVIEQQGDSFVISDLTSTAGTKINNIVIQKQTLHNGDIVRLGQAELIFKRA